MYGEGGWLGLGCKPSYQFELKIEPKKKKKNLYIKIPSEVCYTMLKQENDVSLDTNLAF